MKKPDSFAKEIEKLKKKMKKHASELEFEEAAKLRDEVKRLELLQLSFFDSVDSPVEISANEVSGGDQGETK